MEKGMEKGIKQREREIITRQLKRRFNNINTELENRISELSSEQIENLADDIFDFQSLDDFINWLDQQI